jgi:transcription elongation factor Elf1
MDIEAIFTIGILKGLKCQIQDNDVKLALEKSIDVFSKIVDGYILQKPEEENNQEEVEEINPEEAGGEE